MKAWLVRVFNYASFAISSLLYGLFFAKQADVSLCLPSPAYYRYFCCAH